ncbi:MAG: carbon-nitrogen hydrolase [Coprothermobacterota bacterium]|nr:carbon-nitrogen hydrolase [Coprothermobacterota bacterium]
MPFKVGLAQIECRLGDVRANLQKHMQYLELAKAQKIDLLVFPELSLTGYNLQDAAWEVALSLDSPPLQALLRISQEISFVASFVERHDGFPVISAAYFEGGQIRHIHRKVYLPTHGLFQDGRDFARGDAIRAFDTKFGRMGMLICRDAWHLSSAYLLAQDGARYLVLVNASPVRGVRGKSPDPDPQLKSLFNVYATYLNLFIFFAHRVGFEEGLCYYGGSVILDPFGRTVASAPYFVEDLVVGTIDESLTERRNTMVPLGREEDLVLVRREMERIAHERASR